MSKGNNNNEIVVWFKLTENNEWEGETWYHYFINGKGVYKALLSAIERSNGELEGPKTIELTWDATLALANLEPGYMDVHWFGELKDFGRLAGADEQKLYKGGIRDYGEELFTRNDDPGGDEK